MTEIQANKYKVLVVDDDCDARFIVAETLKSVGYQVVDAADGSEGWEVFQSEKPDLAILDLVMETHDAGFLLAYKIKRADPNRPVILLTGVNRESEIPFGLDQSKDREWIKADIFLDKPADPVVLLQAVADMLTEHAAPRSGRKSES